MRISALAATLGIVGICWCVFGTAIHGWKILLYPMAWSVIVLAFYFLNRAYDQKRSSAPAADASRVVEKKQPSVALKNHDAAIAN